MRHRLVATSGYCSRYSLSVGGGETFPGAHIVSSTAARALFLAGRECSQGLNRQLPKESYSLLLQTPGRPPPPNDAKVRRFPTAIFAGLLRPSRQPREPIFACLFSRAGFEGRGGKANAPAASYSTREELRAAAVPTVSSGALPPAPLSAAMAGRVRWWGTEF